MIFTKTTLFMILDIDETTVLHACSCILLYYHTSISSNVCDDLIFAFFTIFFTHHKFLNTKKLHPELFSIRNFNFKKMTNAN